MSLYAVIMAGGVGSRFWPRSRQSEPKQFLQVLSDDSLIQSTFGRLQPLVQPEKVMVVTHERYGQQTRDHLPAVPPENVLIETVSRNTAPAIAYAASHLYARDPEATMIVLPADHVIGNVAAFQSVLRVAVAQAQQADALVTIGIEPSFPATAYGYIQFEAPDAERGSGTADLRAYPVRTFAEKPDPATAERFLDSGDFVWNSGIFIWRADAILNALGEYLPAVRDAFRPLAEGPLENEQEAASTAFHRSPRISIDYGVMERAAANGKVFVVPGAFDWSDVGDWRAVYDLGQHDRAGNTVEGNAILHNASRSYVHSENRLVVLVGVSDLAVVDTPDAVLVAHLDHTQQVKNIVDYLGSHGMEEYL
jgi:mannose-1-phosphate guanylyltransferase